MNMFPSPWPRVWVIEAQPLVERTTGRSILRELASLSWKIHLAEEEDVGKLADDSECLRAQ